MLNWLFALSRKKPNNYHELLDLMENGVLEMEIEKGDTIKDVMFKDALVKKGEEELIFTIKQGNWYNLFILDAFYWKDSKYKSSDFKAWEWNYFKRILVERKLSELTNNSKKKI